MLQLTAPFCYESVAACMKKQSFKITYFRDFMFNLPQISRNNGFRYEEHLCKFLWKNNKYKQFMGVPI